MNINANSLNIPLASGSVQCVVTSPPYWGLRDYGTATWQGGSDECDHIAGMDNPRSARPAGKFHGGADEFHAVPYKDICGKCGAIRIDNQLGLERVPDCLGWATKQPCGECYICHMVAVFREVWRVLREDGVLFLNLGDSYAANRPGGQPAPTNTGNRAGYLASDTQGIMSVPSGLKPKDLIGIPWRVALALQADGWYLRSDIIWAKPNPMPESVTDRPTKAHEYIFLLTKSARYFWDAEAVSEISLNAGKVVTNNNGKNGQMDEYGQTRTGFMKAEGVTVKATRNLRTVWTIATQPTKEAHFATFPEALAERCIKAGSRMGDVVFDPFLGSGTVARVAIKLNRRGVGTELNFKYLEEIVSKRTSELQVVML